VYEADMELTPGEVRVEVLRVEPADADPRAVASVAEAIQAGAAKVLRPRGFGAIIGVRRVVIHPVDYKPRRFERHTAEAVERLLAAMAESDVSPPESGPARRGA
jgi:hypothetical protein